MAEANATLSEQIIWLFVLAAPVACIAWSVTHEDVFAEVRDWCVSRSRESRRLYTRKFFYLFTCEYCFSHYVAAAAIAITGFRLLLAGWVGALIAWLALVWVANLYMSLFVRLRLDIKRERVEINMEEGKARRAPARDRPREVTAPRSVGNDRADRSAAGASRSSAPSRNIK
jgi:hypothetical protein